MEEFFKEAKVGPFLIQNKGSSKKKKVVEFSLWICGKRKKKTRLLPSHAEVTECRTPK